jgi:hypothetical protein
MKRSPGARVRVSMETPVTALASGRLGGPTTRTRSASIQSGAVI